MRRLFWLALGASAGVLIFRKLSQAAQRMTPQGIASSLGSALSDLAAAIGEFAGEVRGAMADHEVALREAARLDSAGVGDVSPLAPRTAGSHSAD